MPVHNFQNEKTGKIISVLVSIKEPVKNHQIQIEDGEVYKRVYDMPSMSMDVKMGDLTKEDFIRSTSSKNYTIGNMMDISKEMSEDRAKRNGGKDPVKEKMYADYEKKTGKKHFEAERRDAKEKLKIKFGMNLDF